MAYSRFSRQAMKQQGIAILVAVALAVVVLVLPRLDTKLAPLVVLAALLPFVAMWAGNVKWLLLAITILEIPIQADIHVGFDSSVGVLGTISGFNFSVATFTLIVLYAMWAAEWLNRNYAISLARTLSISASNTTPEVERELNLQQELRWRKWYVLPLTLYIVCVAVSAFAATDANRTLYELFLIVQPFLLHVYVVFRLRTRREFTFVIVMLVLALFIEGSLMMFMQLTGQEIGFGNVSAEFSRDVVGNRLGGTIGPPNVAAGFLSLLIPLTYAAFVSPVRRSIKCVAVVAFGVALPALLFTQSRGGWVTFALSTTVFFLVALQRRWVSWRFAGVIAVIGALLLVLGWNTVVLRLTSDDNGAAAARVPLNNLALAMIREYPLTGIGANNFALVMPNYLTPDFNRDWVYTVHNKYLLVWSETGFVGLLAFVAFLGMSLWMGWRCLRTKDTLISPLTLGLFAGLCGQLSHLSVEIFRGRGVMESLWLVGALLVVSVRLCHLPQTETHTGTPSKATRAGER